MKLHTKNNLTINCVMLRSLSNGYLLVFAQDRLIVAKINSADDCNEITSTDVIDFYKDYL